MGYQGTGGAVIGVPGHGGAAEWYQGMGGGRGPRRQEDRKVPRRRLWGTGTPGEGQNSGCEGSTGRGEGDGGRGSRGSDVTAPPSPQPVPSQPLTSGSMSLRRADAPPSSGTSGTVGGARRGGAASHWLRHFGLGRATAPPRGCGRNHCRDTSGRDPKHGPDWERCRDRSAAPGHPRDARRHEAEAVCGLYQVLLFCSHRNTWVGAASVRSHDTARHGGLLRVSRSTADTHTVTMVRGRAPALHLPL